MSILLNKYKVPKFNIAHAFIDPEYLKSSVDIHIPQKFEYQPTRPSLPLRLLAA